MKVKLSLFIDDMTACPRNPRQFTENYQHKENFRKENSGVQNYHTEINKAT